MALGRGENWCSAIGAGGGGAGLSETEGTGRRHTTWGPGTLHGLRPNSLIFQPR